MDVSHILENLNDPQREAVTSEDQSLLVLAGAGSGKTRVLVHRIAWNVEAMGLNPSSIMAVTFTNKAAQEMQSRIQELLQSPAGDMWCGTFHGLAHRTLKRFYKEAGLISGFTILDSDDQLRIVKRLVKEAGLDDGAWPPKQMQWQINGWKDEGIRADKVNDNGDFYTQTVKGIYKHYEDACLNDSLVDFAELLLKSYELVKKNKEFAEKIQSIKRSEVEEKEQNKSQEDLYNEESIYAKFTTAEDNKVMPEFHSVEWDKKLSIISKFKDERLQYFGKKLLYMEKPELLSKEEYNLIHKDTAKKLLSTNNEKWNTIPRTYSEIDTLRAKFEKQDDKEKLKILDDINAYVEDLEKHYSSA